jgi:DNA polymerase-3 subunit alpha
VKHGSVLARFANASTDALREFEDGTELTLGVMLSQIRFTITRNGRSKGERMAMLSLEDLSGKCDAVIFPRDLAQNEPLIKDEEVVFVRGRLNLRRDTPSITISEIVPLKEAPLRLTESVALRLKEPHQESRGMEELRGILMRHHGNTSVYLELVGPGESVTTVRADSSFSVTPDDSFAEEVSRLLGEGHLRYNAVGPRKQSARNGGRNWHRN